jgi:hypothetical protein
MIGVAPMKPAGSEPCRIDAVAAENPIFGRCHRAEVGDPVAVTAS